MKGVRRSNGVARSVSIRRGALLSLGLSLAAGLASCTRAPADLREWRASDHGGEGASAGTSAAPVPPSDDDGDPALAGRALFAVQCASCHGTAGHGDGPQAMGTRPPDMGTAEFQRGRSDEALAQVIRQGRGAMPAFGAALRPEAVRALVRVVRSFGPREGAP